MFSGTTLSVIIGLSLALFAVALALIYLADESVRRRLTLAAGGRRDAQSSVASHGLSWLIRFGEGVQSRTTSTRSDDIGVPGRDSFDSARNRC